MFAIRNNKSGRYFAEVGRWYETDSEKLFIFKSLDECKEIAKYLKKNCYVYSVTAIDEDLNEYDINEKVEIKSKFDDTFCGDVF